MAIESEADIAELLEFSERVVCDQPLEAFTIEADFAKERGWLIAANYMMKLETMKRYTSIKSLSERLNQNLQQSFFGWVGGCIAESEDIYDIPEFYEARERQRVTPSLLQEIHSRSVLLYDSLDEKVYGVAHVISGLLDMRRSAEFLRWASAYLMTDHVCPFDHERGYAFLRQYLDVGANRLKEELEETETTQERRVELQAERTLAYAAYQQLDYMFDRYCNDASDIGGFRQELQEGLDKVRAELPPHPL